ncbi:MAG: ATP-binding cassette domain-containing protein [Bacillota bacterium]|nr:ATP-binding cassette domain-containing protein [Bacillota bacterium]
MKRQQVPLLSQIQLVSVDFSHDRLEILRDFSLNLDGGVIHCLFGPSGCGKTTLIRLLAGLLTPKRGDIHFFGERNAGTRLEPSRLDPPRIGYVFQEDRLLPWCTVRENLAFVLRGHLPQEEIDERVEAMMQTVRLHQFADHRPAELSGGMKQRVNIARAMIIRPTMLLMDEPFKGLDEALKFELMDDVKAYQKEHRATILFTTHDRAEADYFADVHHRFTGPPLKQL